MNTKRKQYQYAQTCLKQKSCRKKDVLFEILNVFGETKKEIKPET